MRTWDFNCLLSLLVKKANWKLDKEAAMPTAAIAKLLGKKMAVPMAGRAAQAVGRTAAQAGQAAGRAAAPLRGIAGRVTGPMGKAYQGMRAAKPVVAAQARGAAAIPIAGGAQTAAQRTTQMAQQARGAAATPIVPGVQRIPPRFPQAAPIR